VWLTAEFFTASWSNLWLGTESPRPNSLPSILHPRPFISVLVAVLPHLVSGEYSFTINQEELLLCLRHLFFQILQEIVRKGLCL
jgi:hypothetical protein